VEEEIPEGGVGGEGGEEAEDEGAAECGEGTPCAAGEKEDEGVVDVLLMFPDAGEEPERNDGENREKEGSIFQGLGQDDSVLAAEQFAQADAGEGEDHDDDRPEARPDAEVEQIGVNEGDVDEEEDEENFRGVDVGLAGSLGKIQ